MAERAGERLVRLLGIVTFLDAGGRQPRVSLEELARQFGVTPEQIRKDIDQLWLTGTPGYFPDDLIDFNVDFDEGVVSLTQARGMTPPLRLGTREGVALIAALRAMGQVMATSLDPARAQLIESALTKLTQASGRAAAQTLDVQLAAQADPAVGAAIGRALQEGRQLRIRYVNVADVVTDRVVDPLQIRTEDAGAYLRAWCTRVDDERTFRLDRILVAEVLESRANAHRSEAGAEPFTPAADSELVRIVFESPARWFAEQVPVENVSELVDGAFEVTLRVGDPMWLRSILLQNAQNVRSVDSERVFRDVQEAASGALAAYDVA